MKPDGKARNEQLRLRVKEGFISNTFAGKEEEQEKIDVLVDVACCLVPSC